MEGVSRLHTYCGKRVLLQQDLHAHLDLLLRPTALGSSEHNLWWDLLYSGKYWYVNICESALLRFRHSNRISMLEALLKFFLTSQCIPTHQLGWTGLYWTWVAQGCTLTSLCAGLPLRQQMCRWAGWVWCTRFSTGSGTPPNGRWYVSSIKKMKNGHLQWSFSINIVHLSQE